MTAKATALVEQAGIGQTELMVRTFAQGLRRVFKGLLGLTIKHQDRPRAVRLREMGDLRPPPLERRHGCDC